MLHFSRLKVSAFATAVLFGLAACGGGAATQVPPAASVSAVPAASVSAVPAASVSAVPAASVSAVPAASVSAVPAASVSAKPAASTAAAVEPAGLVIAVDHNDAPNQQDAAHPHRSFAYNDFFPRAVSVHAGDVLDFRLAKHGSAHTVALASDEAAARKAYPALLADTQDPVKAAGSGLPKVQVGPGFYQVSRGTTHGGGVLGEQQTKSLPPQLPGCGLAAAGQAPCTFAGGDAVESSGMLIPVDPKKGQPSALDWKIRISAPPGRYTYFSYTDPFMSGTVTVVPKDRPATTQAQADAAAQTQFESERSQAMAAERAAKANAVRFTGGAPGTRTYEVTLGLSAADNHVEIAELFPSKPLHLVQGDGLQFVVTDPAGPYTVAFPSTGKPAFALVGYDCGSAFTNPPDGDQPPCPGATQKSVGRIVDPGTSPSRALLRDPAQAIDSGAFLGSAYPVSAIRSWSIVTSRSTKPGTYTYFSEPSDLAMQGSLTVARSG
ncbi:MAG: hypothetical protein ACYDAG_03895 [Chloroflexota bacterium]